MSSTISSLGRGVQPIDLFKIEKEEVWSLKCSLRYSQKPQQEEVEVWSQRLSIKLAKVDEIVDRV